MPQLWNDDRSVLDKTLTDQHGSVHWHFTTKDSEAVVRHYSYFDRLSRFLSPKDVIHAITDAGSSSKELGSIIFQVTESSDGSVRVKTIEEIFEEKAMKDKKLAIGIVAVFIVGFLIYGLWTI